MPALVRLLTEDVRFTMPPLPAWFAGLADVTTFLTERVFATPWRVRPVRGRQRSPGGARRATLGRELATRRADDHLHGADGRIGWLATFVDPELVAGWQEFAADR